MKSHIAKKLILYIVLFSSLITLLITSLQLYTEFKYDIKGINQKLEQIKSSYKNSITQSLWVSDLKQLQIILNGITDLPDIVFAEIITSDNKNIKSGLQPTGETIEYNIDLEYRYNNVLIDIGKFTVIASLAGVYDRLLNRLWIILLSNALKTSFVAMFIYILFYRLIGRHINQIVNYLTNHEMVTGSPLTLERNNQSKKRDELDLLVTSVNQQSQLAIKVKENETHLHTLVQTLPDLVWLKDTEGVYLSCNPKFERLIGNKESEVVGKTDYDFVDKELADFFRQHDKQAMVAGKPTMIEEELTFADDGHKELTETVKTPMYAADGTLLGVLGVGRDITERRLAEELLRRTHKMDALGKLTGGISHDYNNMLGVVLGYAELLQDVLSDKPEAHEYIEEIIRAGERGAKLTNKLLAFSRSKSTDAEKININTLFEEQQHLLEKTLTARIVVELKLDKKLWFVYLDRSNFEDAILNMSINASHAIDGIGNFTIETHNKSIDAFQAKKLGIDSGDYVLVHIIDTGCGIDESTKEKIFDPFYSTKGDKGTGLGLSQVYGFMNGCRGTITVASMPGHGSEFILYFPRYEGIDTRKHDVSVDSSVNLKGKETILVIDDEPSLVDLCSTILNGKGYNVLCAESAKQGLEILKSQHVDLLFSDVIMPEMDGYEFASIVQAKYPNIKIQLASGFSTGEDITDEDNILSKNLLLKPYNSQKLLEKIRALLTS